MHIYITFQVTIVVIYVNSSMIFNIVIIWYIYMYILLMRILIYWFGKCCDELWLIAYKLWNSLEIVWIESHYVDEIYNTCEECDTYVY